jgi:hypothetical protein
MAKASMEPTPLFISLETYITHFEKQKVKVGSNVLPKLVY